MRILFVSNFYPPASLGGYEEACRSVADVLIQRGHTVDILTSDHKAGEVPPAANVHRVLRLRAPANAGLPGPPPSRLTIMRRGFHNGRAGGRLLRRLRPDVVLFWQVHELGRALLAIAEAAAPAAHFVSDAMLLRVVNGDDAEVIRPARLAQVAFGVTGMRSAPIRELNLVFCSAFLRDWYSHAGVDTSRAAVVHHGVPLERFHLPDGPRRPGAATPKILYAGRLVREKGVLTLVEALGRLRTEHGIGDAGLSLVGPAQDPDFVAQLVQRATELGVRDQVEIVGATNRDRMPGVYAAHDIFVLPAEWDEPFSIGLLEAMAVGIPVVATARGGSAEILRDGVNAVVARDHDAGDLAHALAELLRHPGEAVAMGRRAAEEVATDYSMARQAGAIEEYLEELVRGSGAGRSSPS